MKKPLVFIMIIAAVLAVGLELLMRINIPQPSVLGETRIIYLDSSLSEISGLSYSNELGLLAINDENGKIFSLDTITGAILNEWSFSGPNDFEGIAAVGKHVYVINSSGDLFRYNTKSGKTKKIKTNLKHENEIEGLCYNSVDSTLLIAIKGSSPRDKHKKAISSIFKYDIEKGEVKREDFLKLKKIEVEQALGKKINTGFGTSAITVRGNEIFLISHQSKAMLVYSQNKKLKAAYNLDHKLYNQPEGITFIDNVLIISNEKGSTQSSSLIHHYNLGH